jgi:hypothetical protein
MMERQEWEHKRVTLMWESEDDEGRYSTQWADLDVIAREGWELVAAVLVGEEVIGWFKRPKE